jgi:formyl-CoA transferase
MDLLKNLTVLSLEQATVLPYLTYRLAHDGMQVIRLEHPVYGDPNRLIGENVLGEERMNAYYLCINAGKKALTLNLGDPEGQKIFHSLIQELKVDIFTTNQLPRNYQKLGIDYESLKALKPDIIWLGVTGFGPDSNEAAYDPILQAKSGLMDMTGEADGDPQVLGIPLPDMGTSEHSYGLLMKALFSPVSVYKTSNGFVYVAMGNDRQWKSLISHEIFKPLDKPEYEKNAGRIRDVENLNKAINEITRNHTSEELIELFKSMTLPISKIKTIPEVVADPLVERRLLFAEDQKTGTRITLPPPPNMTPFLEESNRKLPFPPRFGEHNGEIYGQIGYSNEDLTGLKEKGVI